MSLISRVKRQIAVYWHLSGYDRFNRPTYSDPVEIKVRWEDRNERDITDKGEEFMARSTVYVDSSVVLGGILWLGLLVDAPEVPPEHNRIRVIRAIPNMRASESLYIARI